MSDIAAQLILHPNVSQGLALVATTIGRDKVCALTRVPSYNVQRCMGDYSTSLMLPRALGTRQSTRQASRKMKAL